jgi:hypothetical protein
MLTKCANPSCSTPFRYLEAGKLFRLEADPVISGEKKRPEYFWLCRACSATMSMRLDEIGEVKVVQSQDRAPSEASVFDLVLLDRHKGRLLNRVCFFDRARRRRARMATGGPVRI